MVVASALAVRWRQLLADGMGDEQGSRPLLHQRGPPMPAIAFPSVSLHVDRHKIVTALSSCGAEIEITHVPEVPTPPFPLTRVPSDKHLKWRVMWLGSSLRAMLSRRPWILKTRLPM